jgi:hypothetical protein
VKNLLTARSSKTCSCQRGGGIYSGGAFSWPKEKAFEKGENSSKHRNYLTISIIEASAKSKMAFKRLYQKIAKSMQVVQMRSKILIM